MTRDLTRRQLRDLPADLRQSYLDCRLARAMARPDALEHLPTGVPADDARQWWRTWFAIDAGWRKPLVQVRCAVNGHARLAVHDTAWGSLAVAARMRLAPRLAMEAVPAQALSLVLGHERLGGQWELLDHATTDELIGTCRCGGARYGLALLREAVAEARNLGTTVQIT